MDLTTRYLGFELPHPFMPGASPLADDLDSVRRLEDAGAAAIVLRSLFEEQLTGQLDDDFVLGPDEYLDQLLRIKETVSVPVIASLNGITRGGWLEFARLLKDAGADALELNVYRIATDPDLAGETLERETLQMVEEVKTSTRLPVAVKLSPFYASVAHFCRELAAAGADGIVLFNRFFQPDIDIERRAVEKTLHLSSSAELLLRLRWLAILSGQIPASLAVTGGVHTSADALKAVMAGAQAVQVVSALFQHGIEHLVTLRREVAEWMEEHGVESLSELVGCLSLARCPDPQGYERANYIEILQSERSY